MTSTSFNTGYSLARNSSKVIQPPGGQSADIFGRNSELAGGYSSASSQASSDAAPQRIHIYAEQQAVASSVAEQMTAEGLVRQQQQVNGGQSSPTGSVASSAGQQQQLLESQQQQQIQASIFGGQPMQLSAAAAVRRTPKKTIPVLRRNPITGEILEYPSVKIN